MDSQRPEYYLLNDLNDKIDDENYHKDEQRYIYYYTTMQYNIIRWLKNEEIKKDQDLQ
jgi:hypothetical protein